MTDPAAAGEPSGLYRRPEPNTPVLGLTYGDSGLRKTTSCAEAFPRALAICRVGGLLPASSYLGLRADLGTKPIAEYYVRNLVQVLGLIPRAKNSGYNAIIIDDLTMMADDTMPILAAEHGDNGFGKWGALKDLIVSIRAAARRSGMHVWMNAHARPPWVDDKTRQRNEGGPMLPSKNQTHAIPQEVDIGLRVIEDSTRWGNTRAAKASFIAGGAPGWWTKDRHSAAPPSGPANLRAILVEAGYRLPRAPGLEWQDGIMAKLSQQLWAAPREGWEEIIMGVEGKLLAANFHSDHIWWAIRDAAALAEIRSGQADKHARGFFFRPEPAAETTLL